MKKIIFEPTSRLKYNGRSPFLGMALDLCNQSYSLPSCSIRVCAISNCRIWVHEPNSAPLCDGMYVPFGESFELTLNSPGVLTVSGTINISPTKKIR